MSDEVLVRAEGVSKKFCRSLKRSLWYGVQDVGSELLGRKGRHDELRKNEFWAVNDVSFELKRGECLGLIGPNGAGKSTLLKMLNGLVKPDKGRITMRGRVGALIELGAGFNPILTARENIYVNGAVLGFSKKEMDRKFDAIVDFAEIEEFIDTPVQNYSSGMKVRLGFAVAAQMEPDVLLIDEVLAVGDAAFKTKCVRQMASLSQSASLIFVSHSMPLIGRMCSKAILITHGRRHIPDYDVPSNILAYNRLNQLEISYTVGEQNVELRRVWVNDVCYDSDGSVMELDRFCKFSVAFSVKPLRRLNDCQFNLVFFDLEEKNVAETFSCDQGFFVDATSEELVVKVEFERLELNPGRYTLALGIIERKPDGSRGEIYYTQKGLFQLIITGKSIGYAPVQFACHWSRS